MAKDHKPTAPAEATLLDVAEPSAPPVEPPVEPAAAKPKSATSVGPYKVCSFSEFHCGKVYRCGDVVDPTKESNLQGVDLAPYIDDGILIPFD